MGGGSAARGVGLIHRRPSKHAPRRGSFAALSEIVREREPVLENWGSDWRLRKAFPSVVLPSDHAFAPYEGLEHNDAMILGCVRERTAFSLTINHYNVWRLAAVVSEDGDAWHRLRDRFPVTLRFEGVREFRVVQHREEGDYRILRASLDGLASALFDVIALRCVGFSAEGLRFALWANGWRDIRTKEMVANEITILLSCDGVGVTERLREDWIASVGEETLPLLDGLLAAGPVQGWSVPDFERFVEERRSPGGASGHP